MFDFSLNNQANLTKHIIGDEEIPLLIIDNFANSVTDLIDFSGDGSAFQADKNNFYPGKRKLMPSDYGEQICRQYLPQFHSFFGCSQTSVAKTVISALAVADTPVNKLRPMQMLPHIDTPQSNQFAVVHYLCSKEHGGTSFYRHKETGYQTITQDRLYHYANQVKKEAIANQIHKKPKYMHGSDKLFEQLYSVEARMNRAIIYPSNLLHSGNVNAALGLSSVPQKGRLTIGSFILLE
ncbi:DUF6445 family protein [Colwellia sp. 12G3]|uniref:DUF6445 family protein n=1 Tax=Colwellia sp. 12G3 TaxID=2058299 RepID=UPI000C34430B|nr:DUF6445 family protein [Colwellia sp. 12G3]PKI16484.1 hypothetical protein CXF71_09780 [Colwellia sp. 12G3]